MFQKAIAVWSPVSTNEFNQFIGFRCDVSTEGLQGICLHIAARSFYRLYVNGCVFAHGPARTAKGYCRVDEILLPQHGLLQLAVEVAALSKPDRCNFDHTMEPGAFAAEVTALTSDGSSRVLCATGDENWRYKVLTHRSPKAELLSHCRGISELYSLTHISNQWITEEVDLLQLPMPVEEHIRFLPRRAPYPTYRTISFDRLDKVRGISACDPEPEERVRQIAAMINKKWYMELDEEARFQTQLLKERETSFLGQYTRDFDEGWNQKTVCIGSGTVAFQFSIPHSEVGFVRIRVRSKGNAVVDVVHSDHLDSRGEVRANSYATRYNLQAGEYDLTTFEPKLARYIKLIIRAEDKVTVSYPQMLEYAYPDDEMAYFSCSDGELNEIYAAARRTLRLNTLDIFMDCPERERGGWLCDSWFSACGAWQMFGDLRVEKDFLENFLITDKADYEDAFFPEVYPSGKPAGDAGLKTWSFWLLIQLLDYYRRSGDRAFVTRYFDRIAAFLDTIPKYIGESGLFSDMRPLFVDWSMSNHPTALRPISIPVNCLIVRAYEFMAELYDVERWRKLAAKVRERLLELQPQWIDGGDGYTWKDGKLIDNGCRTEAGIALILWSGFGLDNEQYVRNFVQSMGPCPMRRPNPNVGRANLFIGLMIRFVVLARLGKTEVLKHEMKSVYLPQIRQGGGTLFEAVHESNGCHGFNGMAGALLTNQVLGLGEPSQLTRTVVIAPHPGDLDWAYGSAQCADGEITLAWQADHEQHILQVQLVLPEEWEPDIRLPFELNGWAVKWNIERKKLNV